MDAAYDPAAWRDFGVALVSGSAALLGLVFVVVSLHLRAVADDPVLRGRAEIMLGLLATTFAVSALLVIPGQSRKALGLELMPIALLYITLSTLATFRSATRSPTVITRDRLARFFLGELSAALIFVGGAGATRARSPRRLSRGCGCRARRAERDTRHLDPLRRRRGGRAALTKFVFSARMVCRRSFHRRFRCSRTIYGQMRARRNRLTEQF
jgi:hypothetical protein